jgi:hypothetical protein
MAPSFDRCTSVTVCVKCGRDYWENQFGRRSTFVTVKLHPRMDPFVTAVCPHSSEPVYAFTASTAAGDLCFARVVPVIEVREAPDNRLYGRAYISTQFAQRGGGNLAIVDGWIPIVSPIARTKCGSLLLSIVFHEREAEPEPAPQEALLIRVRDEILELKNCESQTMPPAVETQGTQVDEADLQPLPTLEGNLEPAAVEESADGYRIDEVPELSESDEFGRSGEPVAVKTFFDPLLLDCPATLNGRYLRYGHFF